jgi:periplasmic protein TonB
MKITKQFIISSVIHVAIVLLLLFVTVKSAKLLKPKPYRVTLTAGEPAAQAAEVEKTAPSPTPPPPEVKTKTPKVVPRKVPKKKIPKIKPIKPLEENQIKPLPPVKTTNNAGAGKGPGISTGGDSVWDLMVQNRITKNWAQPSKAETGADPPAVEYEIVVERSGKISNIQLKKSSGIAVLDNSAMNALRNSDPLPKLPKTFNGQSKTVPIIFRIKDSF